MRRPRGDGYQHMLTPPPCERSDCPYCWRYRLSQTYRRAAECLLHDDHGRQPRVESVHVAETTWEEWPAYDRAMRRRVGGQCGPVRVRRADNIVLAIAAQPLPGSRPATPAEAAHLAIDAIGQLHVARHSYRQLGRWSDADEESEWELVDEHPGLDLDAAEEGLTAEDSRRVAALTDAAKEREAATADLHDDGGEKQP
jgi:hypothetical protein